MKMFLPLARIVKVTSVVLPLIYSMKKEILEISFKLNFHKKE
jgi:hypothetical protein